MRMSNRQFSYPYFIATFPHNGELALKTLTDIYFFACSFPFRFVYDQDKKAYVLQTNTVQKAIYYTRAFLQFTLLLILLSSSISSRMSTIPGPMKIFMLVQSLGRILGTSIFIIVVSTKKFQTCFLAVFNLIKSDSHTSFSSGSGVKIRRFTISNSRWTIIQVCLHCLWCNVITPYGGATYQTRFGLKAAIRNSWLIVVPSDSIRSDQQEDLPFWKQMIGFTFTLVDVDSAILFSTAVIFLFITTWTVHRLATHLTDSLRSNREYCFISCDQIFGHFYKLRKVVDLIGEAISALLYGLVTLGFGFMCLGVYFVFTNQGTSYVLYIYAWYLSMIMIFSARASRKVEYISSLLCTGYQNHRSLRRAKRLSSLITVHEINSGSFGIKSSDIFVITYGFIGTLAVAILSNTTIVIQTMASVLSAIQSPGATQTSSS